MADTELREDATSAMELTSQSTKNNPLTNETEAKAIHLPNTH